MKRIINPVKLLIVVFILAGCNGNKTYKTDENKDLSVSIYAAAGTRKVTEEICDLYEKNSHNKVIRNYASSGTLARQIASGADADVFVSANKQWIDYLVSKNLLNENSIHKIAGNSLAVIAPANSKIAVPRFSKDFTISSIPSHKIAIGDPSYVPVGKYTKMVFDSLEWFEALKHQMVMAKDVSSVLRYVELGECDWGVVYYSEAIQSEKVKIIAEIPDSLHKPIVFYVACMKEQNPAGIELSTLFTRSTGQLVFEKYGFRPGKNLK